MVRELYQLVAITDNKMEYVIELKNENINNRGRLEYIDSGTTRMKDEASLARYLFESGKIPTTDVKFAIKYNNRGPKYLPVIYADGELTHLCKNIENNDYFDGYVTRFLRHIEIALTEPGFMDYLVGINTRSEREFGNGNYVNQRLITSIIEFYNTYVVTNRIDADKTELRYAMLKELYSYKQLRTLRMFYLNYQDKMQKANGDVGNKIKI